MNILEQANDAASLAYIIYDLEHVLSYRTMRYMTYDYIQHHRKQCGCEFCLADISILRKRRGLSNLRTGLIVYLRDVHEKRANLKKGVSDEG